MTEAGKRLLDEGWLLNPRYEEARKVLENYIHDIEVEARADEAERCHTHIDEERLALALRATSCLNGSWYEHEDEAAAAIAKAYREDTDHE